MAQLVEFKPVTAMISPWSLAFFRSGHSRRCVLGIDYNEQDVFRPDDSGEAGDDVSPATPKCLAGPFSRPEDDELRAGNLCRLSDRSGQIQGEPLAATWSVADKPMWCKRLSTHGAPLIFAVWRGSPALRPMKLSPRRAQRADR